jgi:formate dehydrogenase subunit gamma
MSRIIAAFKDVEAPLLEMPHAVQTEFGCVPEEAQRAAADALNLSRAEVHGGVSFYHELRPEPTGRHRLRV